MHGIFSRLGLGAKQARVDPTMVLLEDAAEAVQTAQARIKELTEALQEMVDLSDGRSPRDLPEVRRVLLRAKRALSAPSLGVATGHSSDQVN